MADKLFRAGGASAELVAQMPAEYIAQALEVSQEEAEIILSKVKPVDEAPVAEPAVTPVAEESAETAPVEAVVEAPVDEVADATAEESSEEAESTEA